MKKTRVAINGFGRIGRAFMKLAYDNRDIEVVAINDLGNPENLAYLLRFDSVYGRNPFDVQLTEDDKLGTCFLLGGNQKVSLLSEKEPKKLPWKELDIDVVIESTGFFTKYDDARNHIKAGAKRVIISAPAKGEEDDDQGTVLLGVNDVKLKTCSITSNASCTTNSAAPLITILEESIGIEKALLNTVHAYTATQSIVDTAIKGSDFRKGRAGAINIIPTSTGAAKATTLAVTSLTDKFDGIALRVPVPAGSIADITFIASKNTSVEEVNEILRQASLKDRWKGIFTVVTEPVVSQDIVGNPHASIADLAMTRVVGGNLVKVLAWYDNEIGYTSSLVEHAVRVGLLLKDENSMVEHDGEDDEEYEDDSDADKKEYEEEKEEAEEVAEVKPKKVKVKVIKKKKKKTKDSDANNDDSDDSDDSDDADQK